MYAFGKTLKSIRKQSNMSLKELHNLSGISVSFLSSLERGEKSPTLDTLQKLSSAFNLQVSDLIGESHSPEIVSLVKAAKKLNPHQLENIVKFLNSL